MYSLYLMVVCVVGENIYDIHSVDELGRFYETVKYF